MFRLRDEYSDEFRTFKPDKKLKWLPHLGTVQLQLELEDRTLDVDVLPLEAAFIELFSHKSMALPSACCSGSYQFSRCPNPGRADSCGR